MLRLTLLGGAGLEDPAGSSTDVVARAHPIALLALLALAPGSKTSRSKLVGLLWPESPESKARNRLNTCLHRLRRGVGGGIVASAGDDLRVNRELVSCDVWEFEDALERGEYERAVRIYTGPFLDGFYLTSSTRFEKWAERERTRLQRAFREALETLAEEAEERGDVRAAVRWWSERAGDDPYDGRVVQRLMKVLDEIGNRAEALRVARAHERSLKDELGVEPSAEVRRLAQRLREEPRVALPSGGESEGPFGYGAARDEGAAPAKTAQAASPRPEPCRDEAKGPPAARRLASGAAVVLLFALLGGATGWYLLAAGGEVTSGRGSPKIAVLPFTSLGEEDPGELTAGLHADLLTRLAQISELEVVSSTSVQRYRSAEASVPGLAEELGVGWIVEGAVQRSGDEIRVNAQLIDAHTDTHVWAETYRRDLTAEGLFEIQAELTRRIVRALEAELTAEEGRVLERRPTDDLGAYQYLQRGRAYQTRAPTGLSAQRETHRIALGLFDRAIERDSGFAEAWARKASAHLALHLVSDISTEDQLERAWTAAERAREADPEGPWGHLALAELHRMAGGDLDQALEHYRATGLVKPEVLTGKAKVHQARGRLREAISEYEHARSLDPLNHQVVFQSWWAYALLRRYDEAARVLNRVLELAPDHRAARYHRDMLLLFRTGNAAAVGPAAADALEVRWRLGDYRGALAARPSVNSPVLRLAYQVGRGLVLADMGDSIAARATLDSARVQLEARLVRDTTASFSLASLGLAYAGLGRANAALEAAREALTRAERDRGPVDASERRRTLAMVQSLVGEEEAAIATLETYLSNPGLRTFFCLVSHPVFAKLRDQPRFAALERRFGS